MTKYFYPVVFSIVVLALAQEHKVTDNAQTVSIYSNTPEQLEYAVEDGQKVALNQLTNDNAYYND